MTRDFLLLGKLATVEFSNDCENRDFVLSIREELSNMDSCYSFDMIPYEDGTLILLFFYDYVDPAIEEYGWTIQLSRLLTGEGLYDFRLPYPIVDCKQPMAYNRKRFEQMWRKNNRFLGGDDFRLLSIFATYTSLITIIQFEGFQETYDQNKYGNIS